MSKGKKPKRSKDSGRWWRAARPVIAVLLTLAVVAGVLVGLRLLGDEALTGLGPRDRYRVPFADVVCDSPPGTDRVTFLAEVRYAANLPDNFNALDPADRDRLAAAFAAHPWVESVEGVTVERANVVTVALRFRTPVLAVRTGDGLRVLDGNGVVLPESAPVAAVALLVTRVKSPPPPSGQVWDDETVRRAVDLVKAYRPKELELAVLGWRLTTPDGKTLWVQR